MTTYQSFQEGKLILFHLKFGTIILLAWRKMPFKYDNIVTYVYCNIPTLLT
jgi:hypothetical protein